MHSPLRCTSMIALALLVAAGAGCKTQLDSSPKSPPPFTQASLQGRVLTLDSDGGAAPLATDEVFSQQSAVTAPAAAELRVNLAGRELTRAAVAPDGRFTLALPVTMLIRAPGMSVDVIDADGRRMARLPLPPLGADDLGAAWDLDLRLIPADTGAGHEALLRLHPRGEEFPQILVDTRAHWAAQEPAQPIMAWLRPDGDLFVFNGDLDGEWGEDEDAARMTVAGQLDAFIMITADLLVQSAASAAKRQGRGTGKDDDGDEEDQADAPAPTNGIATSAGDGDDNAADDQAPGGDDSGAMGTVGIDIISYGPDLLYGSDGDDLPNWLSDADADADDHPWESGQGNKTGHVLAKQSDGEPGDQGNKFGQDKDKGGDGGSDGDTGGTGDAGDTGGGGDTGDAGDTGDTGAGGDTGDTGDAGDTGDTGAGDSGDTSDTGDSGDAGDAGADDTGDAGSTGDTGGDDSSGGTGGDDTDSGDTGSGSDAAGSGDAGDAGSAGAGDSSGSPSDADSGGTGGGGDAGGSGAGSDTGATGGAGDSGTGDDSGAAPAGDWATMSLLPDKPAALLSPSERAEVVLRSTPKQPRGSHKVSTRWREKLETAIRRLHLRAKPRHLLRSPEAEQTVALHLTAHRDGKHSPFGAWVQVRTDVGLLETPWAGAPSDRLVFPLLPGYARLDGKGNAVAALTLRVPAGFAGTVTVEAAAFPGAAQVRARVAVEVQVPTDPGPAAVTLAGDTDQLIRRPDANTARLTATVTTAAGLPVPDGTPVTFSTTAGRFAGLAGDGTSVTATTAGGEAVAVLEPAEFVTVAWVEAAVVGSDGLPVVSTPWEIAFVEAPPPVLTALELTTDSDGDGRFSAGDTATLVGAGFGTQSAHLTLQLPQAELTDLAPEWLGLTDTTLSFRVPAAAVSGGVRLVRIASASAPLEWAVAPTLDATLPIDPAAALVGATVTLRGTGFRTTAAGNDVRFAPDAPATVLTAAPTALTVAVPAGAADGAVRVTVDGLTAARQPLFDVVSLPPVLLRRLPDAGAAGVPLVVTVRAVFSQPLDPASVTGGAGGSFRVERVLAGGAREPVAGALTVTEAVVEFTPAAYLDAGATYAVTIEATVQNRETPPATLAAAESWTFTTTALLPPLVMSSEPADGAEGVAENARAIVRFNQPVDPATVTAATFGVYDLASGAAVAGARGVAAETATFTPASPWQPGAWYVVRVAAGVGSVTTPQIFGVQPFAARFRAAPLRTLEVVATSPANGALNQPRAGEAVLAFSEPIDPASVTTGADGGLRLIAANGTETALSAFVLGAEVHAGWTGELAPATTYRLTAGTGLRAAADGRVRLAAAYTVSFQTAALEPPVLARVTDLAGATITEALPGVRVIVRGERLTEAAGPTTVTLAGQALAVTFAEDVRLEVLLPDQGTSGLLVAFRNGTASNGLPFTVTAPVLPPRYVEETAARLPGVTGAATSLAVADFNRDGFLDLVVGRTANQANSYYVGGAAGVFSASTGMPVQTTATETVAAGDYNGDGWPDVFAGNGFNQPNQMLRNVNGTFQAASAVMPSTFTSAQRALFLDVDSDGDQDLFIANSNNQQDHLFVNFGGTFADYSSTRLPLALVTTLDAIAGDANGDGAPDLVVTVQGGAPRLLRNNGLGAFALASGAFPAGSAGVRAGCLFDADSDGDLDYVVGANAAGPQVLTNNGAGTFAAPAGFTVPAATQVLRAVRDGEWLVVFEGTDATAPLCAWAQRAGESAWTRLDSLPAALVSTRDLWVGDLDGDGAPDLLAANQNDAVRLFLRR